MTQENSFQDLDVVNIFNALPEAFPGTPGIKAINFSIFQTIVNALTNKARLEGHLQASNDIQRLVGEAFNTPA